MLYAASRGKQTSMVKRKKKIKKITKIWNKMLSAFKKGEQPKDEGDYEIK